MYQSPTFSFLDKTSAKCNSTFNSFSDLNTKKSFPFISTNISSFNTTQNNFIITNSPHDEPFAAKVHESSFRPQNKFILARNVIGSILSRESKVVGLVSKVAGSIWNSKNVPFKNYFEYISLLESAWFEEFTKYYSKRRSPRFKSADYISLCSSGYLVRKKQGKKTPYTKFRVSVSKKTPNTSRSKIRYTQLAKIVTEDIFQ